MLSLLVLVRDTRAQAQMCLESLAASIAAAGLNGQVYEPPVTMSPDVVEVS